jgi:hypothetical protein
MSAKVRKAVFPAGVGTLSREFESFARRHQRPLFSVHAGDATGIKAEGSVTTFELRRSPLAFPLDRELGQLGIGSTRF